MEWVEHLNQSMRYIEEHLTDEIDYEELGRIACCSSYHYQRMFTYMAGLSLAEYIRRRRMSLAAVDLQSGARIVDVALKYGYSSPTAFNRAFQAFHGVAPSAVKGTGGVSVKSFSPIVFHIAVKGAAQMDYRIENKEAFRIVGVSTPLERDLEKNFESVPKLWATASADGTLGRLAALMDSQPMGILGVSACGDAENWKYFIAVSTTKPCGGFEEYAVPACTWAIFTGAGTNQSIQDLERRIVTEWLPTSGYEYANTLLAPDIEVYLNPDPQDARYEVWIPVTKKKA